MGAFLALHAAFAATLIVLLIKIVNDPAENFGLMRTVLLLAGALVWELCLIGAVIRLVVHRKKPNADKEPITDVKPLPKLYERATSSYELVAQYHRQRSEPELITPD